MAKQIRDANVKSDLGKMVRACVAWKGETIENVVFTGDFFMQPPDHIDNLGRHLSGILASEIDSCIESYFKENEVILFGVKESDFSRVVLSAFRGES